MNKTNFDSDYNRYQTKYDWNHGKTMIKDEMKYVPKEYRVGFSRYYTIPDIKKFFTDQGIEIESHEQMEWKEKEKIMNEYIEIAKQKLSEKEKELEQLQQPLVKQAVQEPQGDGGGGVCGEEVLFKDVEKTYDGEDFIWNNWNLGEFINSTILFKIDDQNNLTDLPIIIPE